jgi:hypothetical protein
MLLQLCIRYNALAKGACRRIHTSWYETFIHWQCISQSHCQDDWMIQSSALGALTASMSAAAAPNVVFRKQPNMGKEPSCAAKAPG